jgi:hypothetical protein
MSEEPLETSIDDEEDEEVYGFWLRAQADPGHVAVIEPDGTEHNYGEVLATCNQCSWPFTRTPLSSKWSTGSAIS